MDAIDLRFKDRHELLIAFRLLPRAVQGRQVDYHLLVVSDFVYLIDDNRLEKLRG